MAETYQLAQQITTPIVRDKEDGVNSNIHTSCAFRQVGIARRQVTYACLPKRQ
jgi:hypothetical protein